MKKLDRKKQKNILGRETIVQQENLKLLIMAISYVV